ncbi:hypothetical protein [Hyphococcus sp.]|uniref:hypothetical protein n=1 Tax=Hyphococcus sp. TaxID=2038636 RepID=UPI003CCBDA2C
MKPIVLRHLIIGLLIVTGVFHLAVALLNIAPGLGLPLAVYGAIYTGLSFYVRRDVHKGAKVNGRTAIIVAMLACASGLVLGGAAYIENGGPMALPIMFAIDIAIITAGAMWLMKVHAK